MAQDILIRFTCPHCQARLKAEPEQAGARFLCPKCQTAVSGRMLPASWGGEKTQSTSRERQCKPWNPKSNVRVVQSYNRCSTGRERTSPS